MSFLRLFGSATIGKSEPSLQDSDLACTRRASAMLALLLYQESLYSHLFDSSNQSIGEIHSIARWYGPKTRELVCASLSGTDRLVVLPFEREEKPGAGRGIWASSPEGHSPGHSAPASNQREFSMSLRLDIFKSCVKATEIMRCLYFHSHDVGKAG